MKITITTPEIKDLEKRLAEEKDRAEAWELRCEELRDAQGQLDESVRKEARLGLEAKELRDRIGEQNWLIAQYDDDNQRLREANADAVNEVLYYKEKYVQYKKDAQEIGERLVKAEAERDECRKDKNRLMDENQELRERLRKCGDKPITVSLNEWAKCIHENAVAHGWWAGGVLDGDRCGIFEDVDRPLPEILMLCVCELAESMEEYRDGKPLIYEGENGKPEGIAVEMVDCIIRILDWMGHTGVDVDEMIRKKHEYNKTRPYRHGGKLA